MRIPVVVYQVVTSFTPDPRGERTSRWASLLPWWSESLVFAANGFRCPLTELAERYRAERASVTDIYLPKWFARTSRPSTRLCSC